MGPTYWSCAADNDSLDNTKLPIDGSVAMTGALDMDAHKIIDLTSPTDPGDAANKAYVDAQVGGLTSSQWLENGGELYYNASNVGIGTDNPASILHVQTANNTFRFNDGAANTTPNIAMSGTGVKSVALLTGTVGSVFAFDNTGLFRIAADSKANIDSGASAGGTGLFTVLNSGNVGVGVSSPGEKFEVDGNIALSGKLRLKSDNANYVELQAPASLAGGLTFKLPGTAGSGGNALVTDGAGNLSWAAVATGATTVGGDLTGTISSAEIAAGVITNTEVAAGAAIAQSKIANLTTDLAAKEPTIAAGTNLQYWRGDKTWQTLNTAAVPENTNLYFTEPRVLGTDLAGYAPVTGTVTSADTVLTAIQKIDGNLISAIDSVEANFVLLSGGTMTGPLILNADPGVALGAATKQYVDAQITGSSYWTKTVNDLSYSTGNVTVSSGGGVGAGPAVFNINASDAGPYVWFSKSLAPNLAATDAAIHLFGKSSSLNNSAYMGYVHTAAGSANNYITFGLHSNDKLVNITGNGNLGVGLTAPEEKVDVAAGGFIQVNSEASNGANKHLSGIKFKEITGADHGARLYYDGQADTLKMSAIQAGVELPALNVPRATGYVGIGAISPTAPLHVLGNANIDGVLRIKSDNANYVQLRAPAALAGNLDLVWPGTAGASGNALTTDGSGNLSWTAVATTASAVGGDISGTIANAQIVAGSIVDADVSATAAIAQSKIANLTTDLAAKEPTITAGTNLQYWRGDKTWQTLNTTAVPEGTNLYFLDSRVRTALMSGYAVGTAVPLAATDTLIEAIGKLEAQIIANDAAFDGSGIWSKNGAKLYYNGGNVGIGNNNPTYAFQVQKTAVATPAMMISGGLSGGPRIQTYGLDADPNAHMGIGTDMSGTTYDHSLYYPAVATGKLTMGTYDGTTYSEKVRLLNDGSFGIGLSPTEKLDVNGNIKMTGSLKWTDNPAGGGGDASFIRYYSMGVGESTRFEFSVQNDADDHMQFIGGHFNFMPNSLGTGNVGIGTESPRLKLDVIGNANFGNYSILPAGNIGAYSLEVGGPTPNATNGQATIFFHDHVERAHQLRYTDSNFYFEAAGNGYGTNNVPNVTVGGNVNATAFLYTSDKRLKKDFKELKDPIGTIMKLHGLTFTWKETDRRDVGFIAQEVEKVVPELVHTNKDDGKKSVQYGNVVAILVEAFKKHFDQTAKENEKLKREIASLKEENAKMDARLDKIEKSLADKKTK